MKKKPLEKLMVILALIAILKLFDIINWSWYIILSPVLGLMCFLLLVLIVAFIVSVWPEKRKRRK